MPEFWKRCSSCKKAIPYRSTYWTCSVSTCNRKRTGYQFCSVDCWDAHVPMMNHREAWAEEQTAPPPPVATTPASDTNTGGARRVRRRIVRPAGTSARRSPDLAPANDKEVLVIASRLKQYIRDRSGGMNTSAEVLEHLSDVLRTRCDDAIRRAREDGRKTLKARDFKPAKK
ncbi:MAG: hypothetical protein AAFV53_32565 [Myxococcota bacterium]